MSQKNICNTAVITIIIISENTLHFRKPLKQLFVIDLQMNSEQNQRNKKKTIRKTNRDN